MLALSVWRLHVSYHVNHINSSASTEIQLQIGLDMCTCFVQLTFMLLARWDRLQVSLNDHPGIVYRLMR